MAAANKLRKITITTSRGATFEASDNEECKIASLALAQIVNKGTATLFVGETEYRIPYSAVDHIKIEEADATQIDPGNGG